MMKLSDICSRVELGFDIPNKRLRCTSDEEYYVTYYKSSGIKYSRSLWYYNGKYILLSRTLKNQGKFQIIENKAFTASKNFIIIKLKKEFEEHYESILNQLNNNFDYTKAIQQDPIITKNRGNMIECKYIGIKHIKNFEVFI